MGGTNFEGGLGSALKVESMVADEGASVVGGLGVEPVDSLLCTKIGTPFCAAETRCRNVFREDVNLGILRDCKSQ